MDAPVGASVRAYNRMTLDGSTLVSAEDSYRSVGDDAWTLLEPDDSLLSPKATADGYDLSSGGSVSLATNYALYADSYNFSEYHILAVELSQACVSMPALLISFNNTDVFMDIKAAGPQTIYIDLDNFGTDRNAVSVAGFQIQFYEASSCKLTAVRLLKELPEGAALTQPSSGKDVVTLTSASSGDDNTIAASDAPYAEELLNDTLWTATGAKPALKIPFDSVDISRYTNQGYLHFYLYLPDNALENTYRIELTSAGTHDKEELQFEFGPSSSHYPTELCAGWNELWFPLWGALATGKMDFSAANYIRFYVQTSLNNEEFTLYLDGFEIVMRADVDEGYTGDNTQPVHLWTSTDELTLQQSGSGDAEFVDLEDYGRTGTGLCNASSSIGNYVYARYQFNTKNLVDFGGGYLHIALFVPDEDTLNNLGTMTLELTSSGQPDKKRHSGRILAAAISVRAGTIFICPLPEIMPRMPIQISIWQTSSVSSLN